MGKKICSRCKIGKDFSEFHKKVNGKFGLSCYCKDCAIRIAKEYYRDNRDTIAPRMLARDKLIKNRIKVALGTIKSQGCCLCSEKEICCIDFHHVDASLKGENVSYMAGIKNINKLVCEINKCVCVCANCHRKIHALKVEVDESDKIKIDINEFRILLEDETSP